jgi:chorismate mutase
MTTKGIRGAITVEENTPAAIEAATMELLRAIIAANKIVTQNISHVIFTLTNDLNAEFPAKFARLELGWDEVAMMCSNELDVPGALPKCLRVLIVLNCADTFNPQFVYLKNAATLR